MKDLFQKGDNTVYFDVEFVPGETLLELGSDVGATMWLLPVGCILDKYTWFLSEKIKKEFFLDFANCITISRKKFQIIKLGNFWQVVELWTVQRIMHLFQDQSF